MEWIRKRKFNRTIIAALLLTMTVWLLPAGLMVEKAEAAVQCSHMLRISLTGLPEEHWQCHCRRLSC